MKIGFLRVNYKICIFLLGMVTAVIVFRGMDMDFSFYRVSYKMESFPVLFWFYFFQDIKVWLLFFLLSRLKYKEFIWCMMIFYVGFLCSGIVLVSFMWKCTNLWSRLFFCAGLFLYSKILFGDKKRFNKVIGGGVLFLTGVIIQVFLKILF